MKAWESMLLASPGEKHAFRPHDAQKSMLFRTGWPPRKACFSVTGRTQKSMLFRPRTSPAPSGGGIKNQPSKGHPTGLDWLAQPKADGTHPLATLGMRRVSKDDPETVEAFRAVWKSHYAAAAEDKTGEQHRAHWLRPFNEVLEETANPANGQPPFIETKDTVIPSFCTGGSFACNQATSWGGKRLYYCGLPGALADQAYEDMEPAQMLAYAEQLEAALPELKPDPQDQDVADAQETVKEAVQWLRFWAEKGHSLHAWF